MPTPRSRIDGDFASAAMLRVLRQGLLDLGLAPAPPTRPAQGAVVSLDSKRELLTHAVQAGGLGCLALLGRGLHRLAHEPLHSALAAAADAQDLLQRWARLERYIHSRHRVQLQSVQARSARLAHVSLRPLSPPLPAEDLVVLGVLAAFLEACGHRGVRCTAGGAQVYPVCDEAALERAIKQGRTHEWQIEWASREAPPASQGAGLPLTQGDERWPAWVQEAYAALAQNLTAPWTLDQLAERLGQSRRSLQRGLSAQGTGFRQLQAEARYRSAGACLLQGPLALAEIGFLCGYADQSHFTREFRSRSGLTPADFRREFGVGVPAA
jgi:AraC-like DNA-binding protein